MKTRILCALACVLYFTGCSRPATDEIEIVNNLYPVQFSLQLRKEMLPFTSTRSMPPNTIPEPTLPGDDVEEKELKDLCSQIEYIVYKENDPDKPVRHQTFSAIDDPDFGIIYDTLPAGNYQMHFLAHGPGKATLSGKFLSFDKVTDTFFKTQQIQIMPDKEINQDFTLHRVVSRIEFCATDSVPDTIDKFEMTITHYSNQFNIQNETGELLSAPFLITHQFLSAEIGKTKTTHLFYTFLPTSQEKMSVFLSATNKDNQVMRKRTITDIPVAVNKIIRYTGILYTPPKPNESENTFPLNIENNGKWNSTDEKELAD